MTHSLLRHLGDGTLPTDIFKRYLVQEFAFVETAAIVTAYAITRAPDMADRARLTRALSDLTTIQTDYFRTTFEALAIEPTEGSSTVLPPAAQAFADFAVRTGATDGFLAILTLTLAAEWLYATWGSRAIRNQPVEPHYAAWISIHASPEFVSYVEWLRSRLDKLAPLESDATRRHLLGIFERTLQHEIAFHDAPYAGASADAPA